MRRLMVRLFTLALIALIGYNAWQISMLRKEIASLKEEIVVLKTSSKGESSEETKSLPLITKARGHVDEARRRIIRGDVRGAKAELEKSLQIMQRMRQDATVPSQATLDKAERALQDTRSTIERLWRKLDKEPDIVKGG